MDNNLKDNKKVSYKKLYKHWFDYDWFRKKQKYSEVMLKLDILEERINELEKIPLNTKDLIQQLHERICKLEKIVNNQPLIKKYQKILDIFLKNAQD